MAAEGEFFVMSKDSSNPFSALRIEDFPKKSEKKRSAAAGKKSKGSPLPSEESELFLAALGGSVQKFGKEGREQERVAASENNDAFFNALPLKKEASPKKAKPEKKAAQKAVPGTGQDAPQKSPAERESAVEATDSSAEFLTAMSGVAPLNASGRDIKPAAMTQPGVPPGQANPLQDLIDGKIEFAVENREDFVEGHVVGLDCTLVEQLRSRQFSYEAHIDLHGLNSEQAYWNLIGFFRSAYYKGLRVVLIVTGRGLNSPFNVPVLRGKVQHWMSHEPLKRIVLAFCSAKQEDGGVGALYVLLRKRKKNSGKICWDIAPCDADLNG